MSPIFINSKVYIISWLINRPKTTKHYCDWKVILCHLSHSLVNITLPFTVEQPIITQEKCYWLVWYIAMKKYGKWKVVQEGLIDSIFLTLFCKISNFIWKTSGYGNWCSYHIIVNIWKNSLNSYLRRLYISQLCIYLGLRVPCTHSNVPVSGTFQFCLCKFVSQGWNNWPSMLRVIDA